MQSATGTFTIGTGGVGTTYPVTGLPASLAVSAKKYVKFAWCGRSAVGQGEADAKFGVGYAVSATDRGGVTTQSDHGAGTSSADRQVFDDSCIKTLTITGTLEGAADFSSWDANGFTVIVDDAFPASLLVVYQVVWGEDLLDVASVTWTVSAAGTTDVTTVGFQPDCAEFLGLTAAAINASNAIAAFTYGVAAGSGPTNYVLGATTDDAQATSRTMAYCRGGECIVNVSADAVGYRIAVSLWLSNGFRLNTAEYGGTTVRGRALCMRGGQYAVFDSATRTDTTQFSPTPPAFTPVALTFASHCKTQSAADTSQPQDERSIGFASSASQRACVGLMDRDAQSTAEDVGIALLADAVYVNQSTATTIATEGIMDIVSMTPMLVMDDADPVASFFWMLAVGSTTGGGGPNPQLASAPLLTFE